jgi:poly(A) polymerase
VIDGPWSAEPRLLERSEHPISRKNISPNALKVLYRLQTAGFKAYLVGGGVRDLLLGRSPKDFDAATDARPNEIRRLFRNSRLIGRRFRLVHVFFKEGVVEVSTFRKNPDPEEQSSAPGELLITSDNTFGTPAEDAFRRDFTVNALFYNIVDFSVIDYVGGIEDLEHRLIRVIGDPQVRFREDPVRMLRACEFAARLGFGIERGTQESIHDLARELEKASPARVTEEIVQLLRCGRSGTAVQWMLDLGLLEILLPEAYAMVTASSRGLGEFGRILPVIDGLVAEGATLSDSVLLAALLLPNVLLRRYDVEAFDQRPMSRPALQAMVTELTEPFFSRFALSKARCQEIQQALLGFQHLANPRWSEAERLRLVRRSFFADALALLEIMVRATAAGHEVLAAYKEAARRGGAPRPGEAPVEEPVELPARERPRRPRRRRRRARQ